MKSKPVLVALFAVLAAVSGCRDKESRTQAPAAAADRTAQSAPATNRPQRADSGPQSGNHRGPSDAELLLNMK